MGSHPRNSVTFRFAGDDENEDADDDNDEVVGLILRLSIRRRNMACPRDVKLNDNLLLFLEFDLRPAGSN